MYGNFKKKQYRSEKYMKFVRDLPCVVCGTMPCDPHHTTKAGMSIKATDLSCIPVCRIHHDEFNAVGSGPRTFEAKHNINIKTELIKTLMKYICSRDGEVLEDYDWNIRL